MGKVKQFIKSHPKLMAAIGAAVVAAASIYVPGSGPVVQDLLAAIFGP